MYSGVTWCLVIMSILSSGSRGDKLRIVGGKNVNITQAPYQVGLIARNQPICGGSIISRNKVVTAAHCVFRMTAGMLEIRSGTSDRYRGGTVHRVTRVKPHTRFNMTSVDYDIAVLTVEPDFRFDKTRNRIKLTNSEPEPGTSGTVTGWGWTTPLPPIPALKNYSTRLQSAVLPIVNRRVCTSRYSAVGLNVTSRMICAGVERGSRSACRGDSGGPLVINDKLVGVVSWGAGCGLPGLPTVFTSVYSFRDWIKSQN